MKKRTICFWLIAGILSLGTFQSCAIFKKDCGCPSAMGGKQK